MNPDSRPERGLSQYKTRLLSAALCFLAALHCALLPLRLSEIGRASCRERV